MSNEREKDRTGRAPVRLEMKITPALYITSAICICIRNYTTFANGGCQSLLQSTRIGSNPLLMVDVKVYYSKQERVQTLC